MLSHQITYASLDKQACKNGVRRTRSGRFLILADPAGVINLKLNFKPLLGPADQINNVSFDVEGGIVWEASTGSESLDVKLSSIPYVNGHYKDYGRYSDDDDPNVWVKVVFTNGAVIVIGIIARNYNLPHEFAPDSIATGATTRTWAVLSPIVGDDVAFDPTEVDDEIREMLLRPMEIQSLVGEDDALSTGTKNINTEQFTIQEQDLPDADPLDETPSSGTFTSGAGGDVAVTGS